MNQEIFENLTSSLENNNLDSARQALNEIAENSLSSVDRGRILTELAMASMRLEMDAQKPYQESMKQIGDMIKQLQGAEQELSDIEGLQSARSVLE